MCDKHIIICIYIYLLNSKVRDNNRSEIRRHIIACITYGLDRFVNHNNILLLLNLASTRVETI